MVVPQLVRWKLAIDARRPVFHVDPFVETAFVQQMKGVTTAT